jgi:hypothetical protein
MASFGVAKTREHRTAAAMELRTAELWRLALPCILVSLCIHASKSAFYVLPKEILGATVPGCGGRDVQRIVAILTKAIPIAGYLFGFGFLGTRFFYRHRMKCFLLVTVVPELVLGVGVWLFPYDHPVALVLLNAAASLLNSLQFAMVTSYFEGRKLTDFFLATIEATYLFRSNFQQGIARSMLDGGVAPPTVVLLVSLVSVSGCLLSGHLLHTAPPPSKVDVELRSARSMPWTTQQRLWFMGRFGLGVAALSAGYGAVYTMQNYAGTTYVRQIASASYGASSAPAWVYFTKDLPGSLLSFALLVRFCFIKDNCVALQWQIGVSLSGTVIAAVATLLYQVDLFGGVVWLYIFSSGLGVPNAVLGMPIWDRLMASAGVELGITSSTCVFLEPVDVTARRESNHSRVPASHSTDFRCHHTPAPSAARTDARFTRHLARLAALRYGLARLRRGGAHLLSGCLFLGLLAGQHTASRDLVTLLPQPPQQQRRWCEGRAA